MSAYPVMLEGGSITALVVGGGAVALRKTAALLESGARVHVVAPAIAEGFASLGTESDALRLTRHAYSVEHLEDATLVIAATDDARLNSSIAGDALARGLLVNVADDPGAGNFVTPAVHRSGGVVVAVTAGRVPSAAARIRDAVAARIDRRYADAVHHLAGLRRTLLDAGARDRWTEASRALIGEDFCEQVESGGFAERIDAWR